MKFNTTIKRTILLLSSIAFFTTGSCAKDSNILTYKDRGITYYPKYVKKGLVKIGKASWYGKPFHGRRTANGERYNMYNMTAAHRTYAMNTVLKVTNLKNKKSVKVRVNDRGPFYLSRNIDLSFGAARKLGMDRQGIGKVKIEVLHNTKVKHAKTKSTPVKKKATKTFTRDQLVQIAAFSNVKSAEKFKAKQQHKNIIIVKKYLKHQKRHAYKVVVKCTPWEAKKLISSKKFSGAFLLS